MSRCRFVQPDIVRLMLTDGDWVDIKRELTTGEQREMFGEMRRQFAPGETPIFDGVQVGRARTAAYVVAWSFVDAGGKPVSVSRSAFDGLDVDTSAEIIKAIDAHEDVLASERLEKKLLKASSNSAPTLPSVA